MKHRRSISAAVCLTLIAAGSAVLASAYAAPQDSKPPKPETAPQGMPEMPAESPARME